MDKEVFKRQMERLADCFGAKHYNQDRLSLIWKECGNLSDDWMSKTVDIFVGEQRQAPLMIEFRTEISKERERLWKNQKREFKEVKSLGGYLCSDCSGTGLTHQDGYYFKCDCEQGTKRPENYPRFVRSNLKLIK